MPITVGGTQITFNDSTTQSTAAGFAVGTVLLFYQAAAPTGWTKLTSQDNKALRVVSGSGGVAGGTTAFTTVFANQSPTTGATTLSTSQIPSHSHSGAVNATISRASPGKFDPGAPVYSPPEGNTGAQGGGGSHTHPGGTVTLNVQYIDIILCSKN
jgi:hypothetical protein